MKRKSLVALVAGVAVLALAVWFFAFRHHGADDTAPAAEGSGRSAKIEPNVSAPAKTESDKPSPRGLAPKWSLDVDPEGPLRLEGQVVDADGKGVGGAEVSLDSVPPRTATSEADGSFSFDKLVGRAYSLAATGDDNVGGPVRFKLTGASDPVVIHLHEGAAVEVAVADEKGKPIADAKVEVPETANRSAQTDDKGNAKLKGVHPGWVVVQASATGYAAGSTMVSVGSGGAVGHASLVLRKGVALSGRVIDETGKPLAKVKLVVNDPNGWHRDHGEQTSDDKGQFAFPAVAPGSHAISAVDGEHAPVQSNPITVTAERPVTGIEIVMKAGGSIAGTVVDLEGKPQAYATVRVAGKDAEMWRTAARQATTDQKGKFEVRGLARSKLQARAESDTAASKLADVDLSTQLAVKDVKLVLDVTGTISGTVVVDTNQAVAEVQVNAFPDLMAGASAEGLALAGMSSATTDGAGGFTIHGLPDGNYRLWAARHTGASDDSWGRQNTPAKVGDKNVKIVMAGEGGLIGKLALENGSPPKIGYVQVGGQAATPASPTGAFQLPELAAGPYDLHIYGPEFAELVRHDIKVEPGKTVDLGTITVVRGRRLVGKVVDASGSPVAGARVRVGEMLFSAGESDSDEPNDDSSRQRSAITDQAGTFSVPGLPPKSTLVMADQPDRGQSLPQPVPAGTDDPPAVTLALRGYGSIVGKVTMKGQPQAGVTVSESSQGGGMQAAFVETGADGTFTMPKVAEGTHVLNAMQSQMMSMRAASTTVQVTVGKQATATIDIPVGTIALSVQLKPLPNNKVNAAQVFLINGAAQFANAKQLTDGFFQGGLQSMKFWFGDATLPVEFDELIAGDYSVCSVPITGDITDSNFEQRLQENMQALKVYCKAIRVTPTPTAQSATQELPSMTPLPTPKT
jgi:protocatechuate 3,4-dioxygenase beta subunit